MAGRSISFNSNSLQTTNIQTADIDSESIPTRDVKFYNLAHANGGRIPFSNYPSKSIYISGTIYGSTLDDLDGRLDTFRGYFGGIEKNLDIAYNGITRRFIATANSVSIKRPGGLLEAQFSIEFICTLPFGQNLNATTILNSTGRTSATYSDTYTFLGTAPYQRPIITITLTAVTGGTAQTISVGNNGNGQAISVLRTWTAADVLVIDVTTKIVTVNGIPVDFTGAFPEFPPGSQIIGYSDGFTTRTMTENIIYHPMYL